MGRMSRITERTVTFLLADPKRRTGGRAAGCRTCAFPATGSASARGGDGWELAIDRPPVSRMEYLLELRQQNGSVETVLDPGNPRQVAGAFGPKSVLEFLEYTPPGWLSATAAPGTVTDVDVPSFAALDAAISVRLWSPGGAPRDEPLPLLVVNDGPEYDALASLTRYLSAGVAGHWLPRLRAALLRPGQRDLWYSANARYSEALCTAVLPAITGQVATSARVGMGTSLGALAMLHAQLRYPDAFDALFLQSGSCFFWPRFDSHEQRFSLLPPDHPVRHRGARWRAAARARARGLYLRHDRGEHREQPADDQDTARPGLSGGPARGT